MPDLGEKHEVDADELREPVHKNAGGPVQGEEYRHAAKWEIDTITTEIGAPERRPVALDLYDEIIQDSVIKFREIAAVASAAVYIAARREQTPVTQRTIAAAGHSTDGTLERLVTELQRELGYVVLPPSPSAYLDRIQLELELPTNAGVAAAQLVEKTLSAKPSIQSGRNPAVIAAASVYHVCRRDGYKGTQQAVADAADVDVKALRDIYQQQTKIEELPLNED